MLGLDVLFTYEKEFHQFDNIKKDIGRITILEMLIFFILFPLEELVHHIPEAAPVLAGFFHDQFGAKKAFKRCGGEMALEHAVDRDGNGARFLRDDNDDRVRLLAQTDAGAMAHAEFLAQVRAFLHSASSPLPHQSYLNYK